MNIRHLYLGNIKQLCSENRCIRTRIIKENALLQGQGFSFTDLETGKEYLSFSMFQKKTPVEQRAYQNQYVDDKIIPFYPKKSETKEDISEEEIIVHYLQNVKTRTE